MQDCWAWQQLQYQEELYALLQSGELLAALPAGTVKDMAVTYLIKVGVSQCTALIADPVHLQFTCTTQHY
jgi:hypothetical protein